MALSGAKIPGGDNKGQPIEEAAEKDITFWLTKRQESVATDPNGEYAANNKRWIAAAEKELARRAAGGKPAAPTPAAPTPVRKVIPPELLLPVADPKDFTARMSALGEYANLLTTATTLDVLPPGCSIMFGRLDVSADPNDLQVYPQIGKSDDESNSGPPAKTFSLRGSTVLKLGALANIKLVEGGWKRVFAEIRLEQAIFER